MQGILKKQRGDRSKDAAPNLTMMTPTDGAVLIQSRCRGIAGRVRGRQQFAAIRLQSIVRIFLARRRRYRAQQDGQRSHRLYQPKHGSLRGKWAESGAVKSLPAQKQKAASDPKNRSVSQRLYDVSGEKAKRRQESQAEASEREERAHVAACTFSPAAMQKLGKYANVRSKYLGTTTAAQAAREKEAASEAVELAKKEAEKKKDIKKIKEEKKEVVEVVDHEDEWTTVAAVGRC